MKGNSQSKIMLLHSEKVWEEKIEKGLKTAEFKIAAP